MMNLPSFSHPVMHQSDRHPLLLHHYFGLFQIQIQISHLVCFRLRDSFLGQKMIMILFDFQSCFVSYFHHYLNHNRNHQIAHHIHHHYRDLREMIANLCNFQIGLLSKGAVGVTVIRGSHSISHQDLRSAKFGWNA